MCLAVYIGTNVPLDLSAAVPVGGLGIELASWTPPPLMRHTHVYYVGRMADKGQLGCTCLLTEYVEWSEAGPEYSVYPADPEDAPCPFKMLQAYCAAGMGTDGYVTIACDDSAGVEQPASDDEYDNSVVRLQHIARGLLLFADVNSYIPFRALTVVNA